MFRAVLIGWLIGKAIVGLVRGAAWLIRSVAYLVGAVGGSGAGRQRSGLSRSCPLGRP